MPPRRRVVRVFVRFEIQWRVRSQRMLDGITAEHSRHPVKVQHGSSESNDATLLEDASRSLMTNPGLKRCVLRRACHSTEHSSLRSRSRQLTATGHTRRLLLSAGPLLLTLIVIGHGTKLVAPFLLDLVSSHVPRRAQLARRAARRRSPGDERVVDRDLDQSMRHVKESARCRARAQPPEWSLSSTNETGVV